MSDQLAKSKELLRVRLNNQLYEIAQYFRDIDHWNRLHPDEIIEPDPKCEMKAMREKLKTMWTEIAP